MSEGISEEDRALAVPHETTHIMRQQESKPYMDFLENSPDKVNFVSADAQTVMGKVFEHLMVKDGSEYRLMEVDDLDIPERAQRAYDELAATVYGYYVNGITSGTAEGETLDFRNVFHDYAAYVNEPQGIHEQFKRREEGKTNNDLEGTHGENRESASRTVEEGVRGPSEGARNDQGTVHGDGGVPGSAARGSRSAVHNADGRSVQEVKTYVLRGKLCTIG